MADRLVLQAPLVVQVLISQLPLRLLQLIVKIVGRQLVGLQQPGLKIRLLPGLLAVLHLGQVHPRPVRQGLKRLGEGIILVFHQKGDHISPGPAAEAVIHLLARGHGKTRRLLIVKGAQSEIAGPFLLKLHISRNHIHDVILHSHFFNDFIRIVHEKFSLLAAAGRAPGLRFLMLKCNGPRNENSRLTGSMKAGKIHRTFHRCGTNRSSNRSMA